jgi:hypothetical protein
MRADGSCPRPLVRDDGGGVSYRSPAWRPDATIERDCAAPARHAAVPDVPVANLREARAFRGHPLYWLGPAWRGRHLVSVDDIQPRRSSLYFHYADCRRLDGGCRGVWFQIRDVCTIPPPADRGPAPIVDLTRTRIRGTAAFFGFGQWEVYTGRVVIRVHARGREARQVIAALRGLNAPAKGLRPGQPFPPPIPGALERKLPCP